MEILTERSQVRTVAQRWRAAYGEGTYEADKRGRMVGDELAALDPETATASEVAGIIGNATWVEQSRCSECESLTWDAIRLGGCGDSEGLAVTLCCTCLSDALLLMFERGD